MHRLRFQCCAALLFLMALLNTVHADDATVGTGTPGSCTATALNNAVAALDLGQAPGGTLRFNCGPNPHTILINQQNFLNSQTTVEGGSKIMLDGNNVRRIFVVSPRNPGDQTLVTFQNITLVRGFAADNFGGAILGVDGVEVTLNNVVINDSRALISGGAVAMAPGTLLNVSRSSFRDNSAPDGGAIATSARTVIESSRFVLNTANGSASQGGAIQSWVADLIVRDSVFSFNLAQRGGAIYKRNSLVVLESSRLLDNTAAIDGGAIYAEDSASQVNAITSQFRGNIASQGAGGGIRALTSVVLAQVAFDNNGAQTGGALALSGNGSWFIDDSTFSNNRAALRGGALDLANSTFTAKLFQLTMSANSVQNGLGGDVAVADVKADIELSTLIGGNASAGGSSVFVGNGGTAALRGNAIAVAAGSACVRTGNGALISAGNNVGPTSSCFGHASDLDVSTFAGLGLDEFADYGGNYLNYMPLPGSVLLDRFACAGSDARVKPRQVDIDNNGTALCETGALERQVRELPASVFRDGFE